MVQSDENFRGGIRFGVFCEIIVDWKKETVHSSRMIFYKGYMDGVEVEEGILKDADHNEATY